MSRQLTIEDARESLNSHIEAKGLEIYSQYGPHLGWNELLQLLSNRKLVRYPCEVVFEATPLEPGEFAQVAPKGERPEDGFTIFVHPFFMMQLDRVPCLVLYQLVLVNYGDFASSDDAETFGAAALGILREEYYQMICELADELE